jgi:DNA-binding response OmpR family regulator
MKVLIVENDVLTAASIEKNIRSWGYEVEVSETGKDALQRFEKKRCDVVILSRALPDMTGPILIARLKDLWYRIGIIVLSEDSSREVEIEIRAQGVMEYLMKPVDMKILKEILDHLASKEAKK